MRRQQEVLAKQQRAANIAAKKKVIEKLNSDLQTAIAGRAMEEEKYRSFVYAVQEQEALLATLTGIFAGGKRKKCQEQIATYRNGAEQSKKMLVAYESTIRSCSTSIPKAEAELQELLSKA